MGGEFGVADAKGFIDTAAQRFAGKWFGQEVIRAGTQGVGSRDLAMHRGDEDNGNASRRRLAAQHFADGQSIDVRQAHVEQDEIGVLTTGENEPVLAGICGEDFEARLLQVVVDQFDEIRFVVDHQDFGGHDEDVAQYRVGEQRRPSETRVTK
jgi:hypothetical protein